MSLSGPETALLTAIVGSLPGLFSLVFIVYVLQVQHFLSKSPENQEQAGLVYALSFVRIRGGVFGTFAAAGLALIALWWDTELLVPVVAVLTLSLFLGLGWIVFHEVETSYSRAMEHGLKGLLENSKMTRAEKDKALRDLLPPRQRKAVMNSLKEPATVKDQEGAK